MFQWSKEVKYCFVEVTPLCTGRREPIYISVDHIVSITTDSDTCINLSNGKNVLVSETPRDILLRIKESIEQ